MEIEIIQLVWDEANTKHIWEKHRVTREEVEEAVFSEEKLAGRERPSGRIIIIGLTKSGRMITMFLSPKVEHGAFYSVTARSSSTKERRKYKLQGGIKK